MTRLLVLVAVAALACSRPAPAPAPDAPGQATGGPDVALDPSLTVAIVDGVPISGAQLDEESAGELQAAHREFIERVHSIRDANLRKLIADRLIDREAKARGLDREALLKAEIADKTPPPTEDELRQAWETFVRPRYDVPFEEAKEQLRAELEQEKQRQRSIDLYEELEQKYAVKVTLPAPALPRIDVAATGPARGPADAKVTIVEFSDFQCPFCSRGAATVDEVVKAYGDRVRLVFRHFPLPSHAQAGKAAEASLCADDQGRFWAFHDELFANQQALEPADLERYARELGLDADRFSNCLASGEKAPQVAADLEAGKAAGVNSTPSFFVNGRPLQGAVPLQAFKDAIDAELKAD